MCEYFFHFLVGIFFNIHNKIYTLFCFVLTVNIINTFPRFHDGGHFAALVLFAGLPFINTSGEKQQYLHNSLRVFWTSFSKSAFFICRFDISVLYFIAEISKFQGDLWTGGVAAYYILQVDEFHYPFWANLITRNDFLITFLTYSTMAFELSYPFLVWTKEGRVPIVVIAIIFHLGTIFCYGINNIWNWNDLLESYHA